MTSDNTARPGCPAWCTRVHSPKNRIAAYHEVIVRGFGYAECDSQVTVEQFDPDEPAINVWALVHSDGTRDELPNSVKLSARDARLLARTLDRVPPAELADLVRALNDAAALLGDQGDEAVTS